MRPARLAGILAALLLVGCASAPPAAPGPDLAKAARYSAELDAAQVAHETTLVNAGREMAEGTITAAQLEAIIFAGRRLETAMRLAHAELKVYLVDGTETPAFTGAWTEMRDAKANLDLSWRAAHES